MSDRKLPILGLSGYWPPGTPQWTAENQQNLRMVASINQLALASRVVVPAAFDKTKAYLVPAGQPNAGQLAVYDAEWFYMTPQVGWNINVADELDAQGQPKWFNWTGAAWADGKAATGGAGYDDTAIKARIAASEQAVATNTQSIAAIKNPAIMRFLVPYGDSRSAQWWNSNTTPYAPLARSPGWRIEARSQRVRVASDYMQGVSGDTMAQLLARLVNDTPGQYGTKKPSEVPPCIAVLLCWTNSINAGVPLATLVDQTNAVLDILIAQGHKVMLVAEWPRGAAGSTDGALSADNQKLMLAVHNMLLRIRRNNVFIVDVWPRAADPASVNAYPLLNMLNPDNLHNSNGIAEVFCDEAVRVMVEEMVLPRHKITCSSNTDQYDAVLQPQGCLNVNPMLQQTVTGVSAGVIGANASGVAPAGYTLTASAGLAVVGSFVTTTLPDGTTRQAFRMVVSGTATSANGYASLRQSGLIGKVAVNDILDGLYEVNVAGGATNFACPGLLVDTGLAATRAHGGLSLTGDNPMPASAVRPYYAVPRAAELPVGATLPASMSLELRPYFTLAAASSLTIDLLSASLRKRPA